MVGDQPSWIAWLWAGVRMASNSVGVSVLSATYSKVLMDWIRPIALGRINPPDAKKPPTLVYAVDEYPPTGITISNAIQQVAVIAINLVYPIVIFRAANTPVAQSSNLLSIAMIVLALGTFLQALRLGPFGSGYMCPSTFTATYFAPSLLAARMGGLPLVFGMTIFAGVFEAGIAPALNRLRGFFPPEISGVVIFMIGWSAGIAGLRVLFAPDAAPVSQTEWAVAAITLGSMIIFNIWGSGLLRMICALVGLLVGYVVAGIMGVIDSAYFAPALDAPPGGLPHFLFSLSFYLTLISPFALSNISTWVMRGGALTI